jgi:uridine phosphorylase
VTSDLYSGGIKTSIVSGTQIITVGGTSNGPTSSYSGTLKFSAVPEAGTWLMMIAGIGFAGFALRRRGTETKVSYAF